MTGTREPPTTMVSLMQRYVEDYVNRHDADVAREIMAPDYRLRIGRRRLVGREEQYLPASLTVMRRFPDLQLIVHELVAGADGLAMRFSELGHIDGSESVWQGIGIYRWNGEQLTMNHVEEDYASRDRQIADGVADELESAAPHPWSTKVEPASPDTERAVQEWLQRGDLWAVSEGGTVVVDDSWLGRERPIPFPVERVEVNDLFTAGSRAGFHASLIGGASEMSVAAVVEHSDGRIIRVRAVTNRYEVAAPG
jgi:hypothetical protein